MNNRRRTIPWIIVAIAFLLVAIILILGYRSFKATEKAAFDEFNQRQLVLAREATGGLELYFENLANDMRALARLPEIQHLDETPTRREMQYMFYELEPWGVNDKGVEAGEKGVLIAVPMFETTTDESYPAPSGQFAGVVLCTLELDTVTERFVAPIQSSERGHSFLIDDEYVVLWSPDRSLFGLNLLEKSEGFPAFQQIVEKMSRGDPGVAEYSHYKFVDSAGEYTSDSTEEGLIAYAPIQLGNETWAIGVWAPKEEARQLIRSAYLTQLFVVGLSILVIFLGAAYLLAMSFRARKNLEKEVETKAAELLATNQKLSDSLAALEEAHAFQQSIIDGMAAPLIVIGSDYQVKLMNRAAREFSYGNGDAAKAVFCYQVSHQHEAPCSGMGHPCPMEQVRESGQPATVIHEHYRTNGEKRFAEVLAAPLLGTDGSFQGIIEVSHDITEQKKIEDALAQRMEGLEDSHNDLEEFSSKVARAIQDFFAKLPSE